MSPHCSTVPSLSDFMAVDAIMIISERMIVADRLHCIETTYIKFVLDALVIELFQMNAMDSIMLIKIALLIDSVAKLKDRCFAKNDATKMNNLVQTNGILRLIYSMIYWAYDLNIFHAYTLYQNTCLITSNYQFSKLLDVNEFVGPFLSKAMSNILTHKILAGYPTKDTVNMQHQLKFIAGTKQDVEFSFNCIYPKWKNAFISAGLINELKFKAVNRHQNPSIQNTFGLLKEWRYGNNKILDDDVHDNFDSSISATLSDHTTMMNDNNVEIEIDDPMGNRQRFLNFVKALDEIQRNCRDCLSRSDMSHKEQNATVEKLFVDYVETMEMYFACKCSAATTALESVIFSTNNCICKEKHRPFWIKSLFKTLLADVRFTEMFEPATWYHSMHLLSKRFHSIHLQYVDDSAADDASCNITYPWLSKNSMYEMLILYCFMAHKVVQDDFYSVITFSRLFSISKVRLRQLELNEFIYTFKFQLYTIDCSCSLCNHKSNNHDGIDPRFVSGDMHSFFKSLVSTTKTECSCISSLAPMLNPLS